MELKRVTASDSRRATAMAIARYGRDALIISNERCGDKVHVLVAIDTPEVLPVEDREARVGVVAAPAGAPLTFAETGFAEVLRANLQAMDGRSAARRPGAEQAAPVSAPGASVPPAAPVVNKDEAAAEQRRALELVELLREEFSEMRREFRMSEKVALWQAAQDLDPEVRPLAGAMEDLAVPARLRAMLAAELRGKHTAQAGLAAIEALLRQCTQRERRAQPLRGVHMICGPSGAGKTLMLGKLALAHARSRQCGAAGPCSIMPRR